MYPLLVREKTDSKGSQDTYVRHNKNGSNESSNSGWKPHGVINACNPTHGSVREEDLEFRAAQWVQGQPGLPSEIKPMKTKVQTKPNTQKLESKTKHPAYKAHVGSNWIDSEVSCLCYPVQNVLGALLTDRRKGNLKESVSAQSSHPQGRMEMEKPVYISIWST